MNQSVPDATFTRMEDGTAADYAGIAAKGADWNEGLADRVLDHLRLLAVETGGFAVDRLTHSLQSATRAERDGRDEDYVVAALLHDIGDTLGSMNHAQLAATILEPFVSERIRWIVAHHGIFQGYYFFHHWGLDRSMRDRFRDSPYFADTVEFCANYDQNCFDPNYDTLPLEHFQPMVRQLFAAPARSIYLAEA